MPLRKAHAVWEGSLKEGSGTMKFSTYEGPYTWSSRFEEAEGTNPEELLGAAHAGCFSMSLSSGLTREGFAPKWIKTTASVNLGRVDGKARILSIELESEAEVPGISNEKFLELAEAAKSGCPVSVALAGVEITLLARLIQ
jgi:osmotically inducible protein OsmC